MGCMGMSGLGRHLILVAALIGLAVTSGSAEEAPSPEANPGARARPPRLQACENASEGDECAFAVRGGGERKGRCTTRPRGLLCLPERLREPSRAGRTPPAVAACEQASAGDACSFDSPRGPKHEGECKPRRSGLVCVPTSARPAPAPAPALPAPE